MRRREFVSLVPASLMAQPAGRPLPQFASLAHQLVWRNWDLVPIARIASALSSDAATILRLAGEMRLQRQVLDGRFARRQRFQILRRNWTFVPMEQLTVLADMSEVGITSLLAEDAFYNGHLGPKPEARRISVVPGRTLEMDYAVRGAAKVTARFDFDKDLERDTPGGAGPAASASFEPRIGFPYSAVYGDVLGDPDFHAYYPDAVLESLRRQGLNGIWLHGLLRELTVHPLLPGHGEQAAVRLQRLNGLIERCAKRGLGVYLYLNEPRAMPAAFFETHLNCAVISGVQATD
ncbi:MAG: hypothetical protein QM757_38960 [Paludibaculum sp.]